jgi:hypothetical protein
MVGGTSFHCKIHSASELWSQCRKKKEKRFLTGKEKTSRAARALEVCLDRADNVIEGWPGMETD